MKPPKKVKKGYADGGPVKEYSWDDYYSRLNAWENPSAQSVPQDISQYVGQWIVPSIKADQEKLSAALREKYDLADGETPSVNQYLTPEEGAAALGSKESYSAYLQNVQGYQTYRQKTTGSYQAPVGTAGTMDPEGEKYGMRHYNLFNLSDAQAAANVATTRAQGKPISQAEANAMATPPTMTTVNQAVVDPTPYGFTMPQKPASTSTAPSGAGTAGTGTGTAPSPGTSGTGNTQAPVAKYQKQITNYGQTNYYQFDPSLNKWTAVTQQAYDSGVNSNPTAENYLLDESKGLYDPQGNPVQPVLVPREDPNAPKLKYGGMVKKSSKKQKLANGGFVTPDGLSDDQLAHLNTLSTDEAKQAYLNSLTLPDSNPAGNSGTGTMGAITSAAPIVSSLGSAGIDKISIDPLNKNQNMMKQGAKGYLKGASTGLAIGANPLLMAATSGLSAPIGALAGAVIGGASGALKGKKQYESNRGAADEANRLAAASGSFKKSGYKNGGKIKGQGTSKSDDIAAIVKPGSFIVPAENAKIAEALREQYLKKEGGDADLNHGSEGEKVWLSNNEHMFTPEEYAVLKENGIDVDALAPNAEETGYGYSDGGTVKPSKAKKILSDGKIRGKELTAKQKRYFGWIAGKGLKDGGEVGGDDPVAVLVKQIEKEAKEKEQKQQAEEKNQAASKANQREIDAAKKHGEGGKELAIKAKSELDKAIAVYNSRGGQGTPEQLKQDLEDITAAKKKYDDAVFFADQYSNPSNWKASSLGIVDYVGPKEAPANVAPGQAKTAATQKNIEARGQSAAVAKTPAKKVATQSSETPAPVSQASVSGTGIPTKKTESAATPEIKALQDAFLKEHGGIDFSSPAPAAEGEGRFKAVASDPIEPLLKQYDELTAAGKIGDAMAVEKQIIDLGGQKRMTEHKMKSATTKAVSSLAPGMAATEEEAAAADSTQGLKPSPVKKVMDTIGPAGLLAIGQAGLGILQSSKNKAPEMKVDPVLQQRYQDAAKESQYGLAPAEYANAANRIASARASVMNKITGLSGGDVGTAIGNARLASIDANRSMLDLEAADERMKMQKQGRADALAMAMANQNQMIFAQNMDMFNKHQASSAELISAGLGNLVGSISARENQKRIDERAAKYGNVNVTLAPQS